MAGNPTKHHMPQILRPYQEQAIADVVAWAKAGTKRILLVLPTGGGKTSIGAELARRSAAKGKHVLWLAHRTELIDQAHERLEAFTGEPVGVVKAGRAAWTFSPIQVASIQTLLARGFSVQADVIIIDEAHRTEAAGYQKALEAYPEATVVGLTATAIRLDGKPLGDTYQAMVICSSPEELVAEGFLMAPRIWAPSKPDLEGVKVNAKTGDYNRLRLAEAMDKAHLVGDVVEHWLRLARGRRTVVFASSIEHSRHLAEAFTKAGVWAEHLDGATDDDERRLILARLARHELDVVVNFGVLTEGWDCPGCEVLVLARPTKSLGSYLQMVGRVLRPAPGKTEALVLDHAGVVMDLGWPTASREWSLDGKVPPAAGAQVRTCLQCYAVVQASEHPGGCPCCEAPWPSNAEGMGGGRSGPRQKEGQLAELTPEQVQLRRSQATREKLSPRGWNPAWGWLKGVHDLGAERAFYQALRDHRDACGYKAGWAARMFEQVTLRRPSKAVRAKAVEQEGVA